MIKFFLFFIFFYSFLYSEVYKSENLIIVYKNLKSEYIKKFVNEFEKEIDIFQREIGKYPEYQLKIIIAKNGKDYLKIIKPKIRIIEFSNAVYLHKERTIVVKNPEFIINKNYIKRILLHEYIHSFVDYYFYNPPLWFNEGMAVYFSKDFGFDRELKFVYSYLLKNSLNLQNMKVKYPKNRMEWEFFYAKSALAIKYLYTKDRNRFVNFWSLAKKNSDFYKIFRIVYLKSVRTFSLEFEEYCKVHFKIVMFTASSTLFWGIMPFLLLIGYFKRRIKYRKIYQEEGNFEEQI